jgi:SAM-dependent methyltransferase
MLGPDDLRHIARVTIGNYDRHAEGFREGTKDHDVSQNVDALLSRLDGPGPFAILDLGCGPGRDLVRFRALGHEAIGCEVWHQDFLTLDLPPGRFDGIFANASLFHVPAQELPRVLRELHATLRPRGVLFASNPHGPDTAGWQGERYGAWYDLATWRCYVVAAAFVELDHYYRPPGLPRSHQPWLATVWRKA